jgi:hypothetical protein
MPKANLNTVAGSTVLPWPAAGLFVHLLSLNNHSSLSSLQGMGEPIPSRGRTCDVIVQ